MEVEADSDERHEIEADGAEEHSDALVDQSHNFKCPVRILKWIVFSELGDLKFHGVAGSNFVVDERCVVETWDVDDGCKRNVLVDDTKNVAHARQNDHNVDLYDETYDSLVQPEEEWWVRISKVLVVIQRILHHRDSLSDILLHINMHES